MYIHTYIGILHFLQHVVQYIILNTVLEGQSEAKNIHTDVCQIFLGGRNWSLVIISSSTCCSDTMES